jgi:hypothetical protein
VTYKKHEAGNQYLFIVFWTFIIYGRIDKTDAAGWCAYSSEPVLAMEVTSV